jgi:hypothetical protein
MSQEYQFDTINLDAFIHCIGNTCDCDDQIVVGTHCNYGNDVYDTLMNATTFNHDSVVELSPDGVSYMRLYAQYWLDTPTARIWHADTSHDMRAVMYHIIECLK